MRKNRHICSLISKSILKLTASSKHRRLDPESLLLSAALFCLLYGLEVKRMSLILNKTQA